MTVQELGEQMTAEEFSEWKVFCTREQLHLSTDRSRHAQLLASHLVGPRERKDGKPWEESHFTTPNPWEPVAPPRPTKPVKRMSIAQQVRAMNAAQRRG